MKINTKPLPGMMELLPEWQLEFDRILNVIRENHARFGYSPIDTPVIERSETLLAKAGGETEKQIYRFNKGDNDLSLRFDLTVPTARYAAENFGQLQFPFKRSQIGKVYRGERAQRGRFREFYQCDIDVIGRDELSINYDAEVIAVIYNIFRQLNLGDFTIRMNNRKITKGLFKRMNFSESQSIEFLALLDKKDKISDFDNRLNELLNRFSMNNHKWLTASLFASISYIWQNPNISGAKNNEEVIEYLETINKSMIEINKDYAGDEFDLGINELKAVGATLKAMGVNDKYYVYDMSIVRGLDYYTGTVFETNLNNFREIGSVASGGRYDNLSEYYSREKLPGVGASIGLTRLFWCLQDLGVISAGKRTPADFLIIPFSANELEKAFEIAMKLREKGKNVEVLLEEMKIAKAFKFADKRNVRYTLLIGENEIAENRFEFKDMQTGEKVLLEEF